MLHLIHAAVVYFTFHFQRTFIEKMGEPKEQLPTRTERNARAQGR